MLAGKKLGRYEISEKIGAGGMGEVYLATDAQLDRKVALKVLLPEFCCDDERVQRFKAEAKAASALNHPSIITIHEIDEFDERLFIATEYVDGETLRETIERGKIDLPEALKIAEQVAEALAVAHEAGIVHRDIKPENIMIRRDGYAKILDFGLAKPTALHQTSGAEDATIQMVKTQPGMVMGSVRYMSPEQARGKATDERTDVWSLGVVLYEMLTGKNPFDGETISDSLAALIHVEPPAIDDVPEELYRIARKALRKNASERYQTIKDFALDLKDLRLQLERDSAEMKIRGSGKTDSFGRIQTDENKTLIHKTLSDESAGGGRETKFLKQTAETISVRRRFGFLPLALIAVISISAFAVWRYFPLISGASEPKFQSIQVSQLTSSGTAHLASLSPDSKFVAFVNRRDGRQSLFVRQTASDSAVEIVPPTQLNFYQPTFSTDGQFVYYVLEEKGVGTLYRVATLGGQSKKIVYDIDSKIAFSPDGKRFAFIRHNPSAGGDTIFIADSNEGNPQPFIETKQIGFDQFTNVAWSPDDERLLLTVTKSENEPTRKIQIATIELSDKSFKTLDDKSWFGAGFFEWLKDNSGVVFLGRANISETSQIWHLSYPAGELRQISADTNDYASLSVSADGSLILASKVDVISSLWSFAPNAKELKQITGESRTLLGNRGLAQTPDGKILYSKKTGKEINIFSMDENGANEKQLTAESGFNSDAASTPDGRYIVFNSNREGAFSIWRMEADGRNPVRLTKPENAMDSAFSILNDSKSVVFTRQKSDGSRTVLMRVSIDGGEEKPLMPNSSTSDAAAQISPDGKRIAYHSFEFMDNPASFKSVVKIAELADAGIRKTEKEMEISPMTLFRWSPDGKSLTYLNRSGTENVWSLSLSEKKEKPITEFGSGNITNFSWAKDGKKLFIARGIFNSDLVLIKDGGKFS